MKLSLKAIAVAAFLGAAVFPISIFAGETPYNPNGASQSNVAKGSQEEAARTCGPKLRQAAAVLMRTPEGPKKRQVYHELRSARDYMSTGNTAECVKHAENAIAMGQ